MPPRLKSLELHGYKTFASRTAFEFPGMTTAVVGPNGSGKSNIADALRWVLGEQSYSLLRGKKTEDMIFTGSDQRPRAGMASATIVFDNADGWLPIDYSEVAITRRAYRDGQNEYLINGQRVRLREIGELLAKSGLAERTYTIIGQGLVDAALALKPEERRRLFEEAAGIGLFRSRKEDALNRLESTRRNLERVQDILAELEPRLKSLERQARRAIEYEQVRADLRVLLRDWYGFHWQQRQQDIKQVVAVLHAQEEELGHARQHMEEVSQEMSHSRGQLLQVRERLNGLNARSAELHSQLERVGRDLAIMDERRRSLTEQRASLLSDLGRYEEEIQSYTASLQSACEERDRLSAEVTQARKEVESARAKLGQRQQERAKAERILRDARQTLSAAETRLVQTRAHRSELVSRVEGQQRSLESVEKSIVKSKAEMDAAAQAYAAVEDERKAAEAKRAEIETRLTELRQRLSTEETRARRINEERAKAENERAKYQVQWDVLEQAEKNFSGYAEGAQFLLKAAGQGRLKGGYRPVSAALLVPAELEIAIAAALGEYLDLVLLEKASDPDQAFMLLEQGSKLRVAMLPLDWAAAGDPLNAPDDPDCLGVASDLVKASDEVSAAAKLLLGQVLVARDRSAARRILRGQPAHARAVTLRGEVFYASGPVVAGAVGKTGAISRPRQKNDLQADIARLDASIHELAGSATEAGKLLETLRAEETQWVKESRAAGAVVEKSREAYNQAHLAVEQARRQSDWLAGQKRTLESQVVQTGEEQARLVEEIRAGEAKIAELSGQLKQAQQALSALPLDELQTQLNSWETAAAVAGRAARDAENRVQERQSALERSAGLQASLRARHADTLKALDGLQAEKSDLQTRETQVSEALRLLRVEIDPADIELRQLERSNEELQTIESSAQQALMVAERHHTQAQLDVTRQRESLDSLHRRIEEDFGLVALEYSDTISGQTPLPFEGMVESLPAIKQLPAGLEDNIARQRAQLRRIGAINPEAQAEYLSVKERYHFLTSQVADLRQADIDLRAVIGELDEIMRRDFRKTFNAVAIEFKGMFSRLFAGGSARLVLTDDDDPNQAGIDIEARLPGRREQGLSLLSGGERSLTAVALVFAILKVSPTPFCVMDEVDAMLDESNVGRFTELLAELSQTTQFIVITHNRNTVQVADVIYGVTMGRDSSSQVISLRLDEIADDMLSRG